MNVHAVLPGQPERWTDWSYLTPTEHGDEAFTAEECDRILTAADTRTARPGTIGKNGNLAVDTRAVEIVDLHDQWLFQKLAFIAAGINRHWWNLDLTHLDNIEVLRYQPGGHYVEHVDWTEGFATRKLSLVVMLSDPDDYEGGNLLIRTRRDPMVAPRERGAVTIFPSWTLHTVTPVTAGERRVATCWVHGPPFR